MRSLYILLIYMVPSRDEFLLSVKRTASVLKGYNIVSVTSSITLWGYSSSISCGLAIHPHKSTPCSCHRRHQSLQEWVYREILFQTLTTTVPTPRGWRKGTTIYVRRFFYQHLLSLTFLIRIKWYRNWIRFALSWCYTVGMYPDVTAKIVCKPLF